jgi:hypothetical protein
VLWQLRRGQLAALLPREAARVHRRQRRLPGPEWAPVSERVQGQERALWQERRLPELEWAPVSEQVLGQERA